jgi:conserved hypothetical integral membrane protein
LDVCFVDKKLMLDLAKGAKRMFIRYLERIGQSVINALETFGAVILLIGQTIEQLRHWPRCRHVLVQMAHLGVDSLPIVLLTMLFTGMVITLQVAHEFIRFGAQSTIGGVISIAVGRELAPVLTGVVAAGRVGSAITAEISTMKVTEQIDALKVMATNPVGYLVVPRLLACMIMVPLLVVFGDAIGTFGGWLISTYYAGINSFTFIQSIYSFTVVHDVTGGLVKVGFLWCGHCDHWLLSRAQCTRWSRGRWQSDDSFCRGVDCRDIYFELLYVLTLVSLRWLHDKISRYQ